MRQRDRRAYCDPLFATFLGDLSVLIGAHSFVPAMSRSERPATGGELFFREEFTGDAAQAPLLHRVNTFGGDRAGPEPLLAATAKILKIGS